MSNVAARRSGRAPNGKRIARVAGWAFGGLVGLATLLDFLVNLTTSWDAISPRAAQVRDAIAGAVSWPVTLPLWFVVAALSGAGWLAWIAEQRRRRLLAATPRALYAQDYNRDAFKGIVWRFSQSYYRDQDVVSWHKPPVPCCPILNCEQEFDRRDVEPDWFDAKAPVELRIAHRLLCTRCGYKRTIYADGAALDREVKKELERRLRTGDFADATNRVAHAGVAAVGPEQATRAREGRLR